MRSVAMTLLLLGGCFAVYDDDLPGAQPDWHTELEQRRSIRWGCARLCPDLRRQRACLVSRRCVLGRRGAEPVEGAVDGYRQILA